jgi:AraC-like DNA-binding protein/mannose-6-phosphate isomerase-like protein (cupin superfamily)
MRQNGNATMNSRQIPVARSDGIDRPVLAFGTDYPDGTLLSWHCHARAQLLYAAVGTMRVDTENGTWIVPPQQAVWIPAGHPHQVLMQRASTRSVYVDPPVAPRSGQFCEVLQVTPLLRQLLIEAVEASADYKAGERDGALFELLLHEIGRAAALPLHVPLPASPALLELCRRFLHAPDIRITADDWARGLAMSRRSLNRLFLRETGTTLLHWRQRACVLAALSRLADGTPVTVVALDQGYESPAAFTTMFKRILDRPPSAFMRHRV